MVVGRALAPGSMTEATAVPFASTMPTDTRSRDGTSPALSADTADSSASGQSADSAN
jgi:hypothetical protein